MDAKNYKTFGQELNKYYVFNKHVEQWANKNGFSKVGARKDFVKYIEVD